ncbi:hypothetical protein AB0J03_38855 [Streptomyces microflavus]
MPRSGGIAERLRAGQASLSADGAFRTALVDLAAPCEDSVVEYETAP